MPAKNPAYRQETVRQEIKSALKGQTLSAKDISGAVRVSEKEVYEHLYHIQKTINKRDRALVATPAACKKCGFTFRKREKLKKPGKCPVCRSETIKEPLFSIP
ncbi:MAG TPA: transcriptional regulator [Nitrospirae bacterium]|nr:transcriptional regulator [Nitrospirota bacterium]